MKAVTLQPKTVKSTAEKWKNKQTNKQKNDKMKNDEKSLSELRPVQWACWDCVLKLIHQIIFHPKQNGKIQVGLNITQ